MAQEGSEAEVSDGVASDPAWYGAQFRGQLPETDDITREGRKIGI